MRCFRGRFRHFKANLFMKWCTRFHQNCQSFIEGLTKKWFGLFFSGHTVSVQFGPVLPLLSCT